MNGEYLSLETAKAINNLKKSRDNLVDSALQMDKIVNEKQQMIEKLQKELGEEETKNLMALHRLQLIQMDGEVTMKDIHDLVNILRGEKE